MKIARRRLTRKLIPLFLAPVALGLTLFGAVTMRVWRAALVEDASERLADHAATLRASLAIARPSGPADAAALVQAITAAETVHGVALYDARGEVIARSPRLAADAGRLDAIARATLATGEAHHALEPLGDRAALVRAERVDAAGIAVAVIAGDAAPIDRMIRRAEVRIVAAGLLIAASLAAIALWMARALGGGLGQLVDAAARLAHGELLVDEIHGSRFLELDRVASAINDLSSALAAAHARADRAEIHRGALEQRIMHAQALAVVGQVASSVAHEIGSPLSTILGWSRLAAGDEATPPAARAQFEMIAAQSARITRIVERLLSLSRPPRERRELVSAGEVAAEVTAFLAPELRANHVTLTLDASPSAPRVLAVRDQLVQVLMNLCLNAVQVQPSGGALRVRVAERDGEGERALTIEVSDAGPGVPEDRRAQVFEPFYSTRVEGGGTGLGLAVVADIVRELGGRVSIDDAPGGGARFTVILPVS